MLEPVARNKLSFRLAGLQQDGRGVVVGQTAMVMLLSVERVVSLVRLLSEELSLDDLLPSLRIEVAHNTLGASAYLLSFQCSDSLLLDRVARLARLVGAPLCIGAGQHFVAYRDERAPLGYDVSDPISDFGALGELGTLALYTPSFSQPYRRGRELPLGQLLGQLQLLPLPGGPRAQLAPPIVDRIDGGMSEPSAAIGNELFLSCGRGLLDHLLRYLWHHGVGGELLIPDGLPPPDSLAGEPRQIEPLLRLHSPPLPLLLRLSSLPTVKLLRLEGSNLLVELGYAHPLRLSSLQSLFAPSDLFVFVGGKRGFLRARNPSRTPLVRMVSAQLLSDEDSGEALRPTPLQPRLLPTATSTPPPLKISLQLVHKPSAASKFPPTGTLIAWSRLETLQRLLGLLSGESLRTLRAVGLPVGLLVFGGDTVQHLIAGQLLDELAPQVFVPRGWQLLPELPPSQLRALLSQSEDQLVLFVPGEAQPIAIAKSLAVPLSLRLLSVLTTKVGEALLEPSAVRDPEAALLCEPVSFFSTVPLWGLSGDPERS